MILCLQGLSLGGKKLFFFFFLGDYWARNAWAGGRGKAGGTDAAGYLQTVVELACGHSSELAGIKGLS